MVLIHFCIISIFLFYLAIRSLAANMSIKFLSGRQSSGQPNVCFLAVKYDHELLQIHQTETGVFRWPWGKLMR